MSDLPEQVSENRAPAGPACQSWPRWARFVARRRTSKDKGVGDTIWRLTKGTRLKLGFKALMIARGDVCGCGSRRRDWNELYPYPNEDPDHG